MINIRNKKYLAVVDFEATCCDNLSFPRNEMEIIEIGLVIVDSTTLQMIDKFQSFIKPVRNSKLTQFCKSLTTISQDDVDKAPRFNQVNSSLIHFLSKYDSPLFCSWGNYDKKQLDRDCFFHKCKFPFDNNHVNLKDEFARKLNLWKPVGVSKALSIVNLKFEGVPHRGIDDAKNIAKLLKYC